MKTAIDFDIIVNVHAKTQFVHRSLTKSKRSCSVLDKKNKSSF